MNNGSGERRDVIEKWSSLNEDQGERHISIASKRGSIIRSSPTVRTEPNRRTKKCRNKILGCKRSFISCSGVPESKYRKDPCEKMTHQRGPVRSRGRRRAALQPLRRGTRKVMWSRCQRQMSPATTVPGEEDRTVTDLSRWRC
ncbi:hypothetical protein TNCV_2729951 [Trichonephila clavipes]|nr:hypothetical protein TNCV_2729951 [Trichonephila clavipes]